MKRLGMNAQIHTRPLIQGALMHRVHGDKAWTMPPFRTHPGQRHPVGPRLRRDRGDDLQPVLHLDLRGDRQDGRRAQGQQPDDHARGGADRAHAQNAYFVFQEGNLGSLAPGKYADLLVLDRDYLTVPEGEIKDIRPLITMVGGKVVYDAMPK